MMTIELADKEAAIIIRADGTVEASVPNQGDDEIIHPASLVCAQIMMLVSDEESIKFMATRFEQLMSDV